MAGTNRQLQRDQVQRRQEQYALAPELQDALHAPQWFQENATRQQLDNVTEEYQNFFQGYTPLTRENIAQPPLPPREVPAGRKARRREQKAFESHQKEQYKALEREQRLISPLEARTISVFHDAKTREEWANTKMPHSKLTRMETLRQVQNGDYSNFENLDNVMRNVVASQALAQFHRTYGTNANDNPDALCVRIKQSGAGVSALLNPALRLGLSLAQKTEGIAPEMKEFYRKLDEAMSTAVMVETLTHQPDQAALEQHFRAQGSENPSADAVNRMIANEAQQIQMAKRLLLMQLSNFQKVKDNGESEPWDHSMAVALSHCSRVMLTLPRVAEGQEAASEEMWSLIQNHGMSNVAEDYSRASSTHSLERRSVHDVGTVGSKEKKVWFNLINQRGMNCAIGGLGNAGVSGKLILNDGSCGHFYSMHKKGDATHYGAMLMGLESDAAGVTNQMGHTHDIHATAEKASSLGGQRTDEIGKKYGGRQCDLTAYTPQEISTWLRALEGKALLLPVVRRKDLLDNVMQLLAGKPLDQMGWDQLRNILDVPRNVPGHPFRA